MHKIVFRRIASVILAIIFVLSAMIITYSSNDLSQPRVRQGLYSPEFAAAAASLINRNWEEGSYFSSISLELGSPLMTVDSKEIRITPVEMDGDRLYIVLEELADVIGFSVDADLINGRVDAVGEDDEATVIGENVLPDDTRSKDTDSAVGDTVVANEEEDPVSGDEVLSDNTSNGDTVLAAVYMAIASEEEDSVSGDEVLTDDTPGGDMDTDLSDTDVGGEEDAAISSGEASVDDTLHTDTEADSGDDRTTRMGYDVRDLEDALNINIEIEDDVVHITKPFQLGQLILQTRSGASLSDNYGAVQSVNDGSGLYLLQYASSGEAEAAHELFSADGNVQYVEPNQIVMAESLSWGTDRIGANSYKEYLISNNKDTEVIVAVLDTGVNVSHSFFSGRTVAGYNFVDGNTNPYDTHSHGTHVAGTIADCTSSNVKIMPVKVLGDDGYGTSLNIAFGIDWAAAKGAKVINMSLGGYGASYSEELAVNNAFDQGVVSVAAAGNDAKDTANFYPAAIANVITVSAVNRDGTIAWFSNYGDAIDVAAPGVDINSAIPNNRYGVKSGTSMAAPHVAAGVALLFTDNINLTPAEMKDAIRQATDKSGSGGWDKFYGTGILNLRALLGANDEPYDMKLTPSSITASIPLQLDQTIPLQAIISPDYATNKSVTYTSSNESVAIYENGGVLIKGEGETTITGTTVNGISATCTVTVNLVSASYDNWIRHAASDFAHGTGSSSDPYLIYTPQELAKLARDAFYNTNGYNQHGYGYYKLMNDIDLGGKEWMPIYYYDRVESTSYAFTGNFDGNNHIIKNMTISDETVNAFSLVSEIFPGYYSTYYMGFVGYIANNTIKNLGIVDACISVSQNLNNGILGANVPNSIISQCYTTGKTTGSGFVDNLSGSGTISNCYSTAESYSSGFIHNNSTATNITDSYASGNVTGNQSAGFAYQSLGPITNSFYAGMANSGVGFVNIKSASAGAIRKGYYLSSNSTGVSTDSSTTMTDVTPKEMSFFTDRASYTDQSNWDAVYSWDFNNIWAISPEINNGLPYFKNSSYYKQLNEVDTPKATPDSSSVAMGTSIELSTDTLEATIYYTLDETQPAQAYDIYQGPIVVSGPMTIKAYATKPGMTDSGIATFNYTIDAGVVAAPVSNVPGGEVPAGTEVSLSTATDGAVIYYTTDGRTPLRSSFEYENPIEITNNMVIKAFAVKNTLSDSAVSAFSYTTFAPAVPSITVTATGLDDLKVGKAVSGAGIQYMLYSGAYAAAIAANNFTISGLPAGLTAGTAVRMSNHIVTIPVTGTPTTHSTSPASLAYANVVPAANIQGSVNDVTPIGTVTASAVAKGDGAPVSGPPMWQGKTHDSITVATVANAGSTDQSVQYAISMVNSVGPSSLIWQGDTIFSGLLANTTYYIYARTSENQNYNAGAAQVSAAITTSDTDAPQSNPPASTSGGRLSSGRGRDNTKQNVSSSYWIEPLEAKTLAQAARDKQLDYARSRRETITGILKESLQVLSESGLGYRHDTVADKVVQVRVYIDEPGKAAKDILVSGYVKGDAVDKVTARLSKWFQNDFAVIHMEQQDSFGINVGIAAKVNLSGMNVDNLYIYVYNKSSNTYRLIKTGYWIDKKGYLHFNTTLAGDIIISDGPIVKDSEQAGTATTESSVASDLKDPTSGGNDVSNLPMEEGLHNPSTGGFLEDGAVNSLKQNSLNDFPKSGKLNSSMVAGMTVALLFIVMILWALIPHKNDEYVTIEELRNMQGNIKH